MYLDTFKCKQINDNFKFSRLNMEMETFKTSYSE